MERKIGEIFEYEGNWYQCVEPKNVIGDLCKLCGMRCSFIRRYKIPECRADFRSDGKYVIYKKLEKVGDPYPLYDHIVQRYAGIKSPFVLPREPYACFNLSNNTIDIEVKQDKPNIDDMEANEKTMPVPDGWEFDRIDENGNIVLKEKKKELPKTWLKCLYSIGDVEYIEEDSEINKCNINDQSYDGRLFDNCDHNLLPYGLGKPMLALCQLLVCRNAWWKQLGWKPDWSDRKSLKHCIHSDGFITSVITRHSTFPRILAFPTEDTAMEFCNTFKDLIKEAKELL